MIENSIKYLIFDYGDVLVYPVTGNWFITPNFYNIIEKNEIDMDAFGIGLNKASKFISSKMLTEEEEYSAFKKVYEIVLKELGINENLKEKAEKIAYEFVYSNEKHKLYEDVEENLERLYKKYKLIMLSDNWPCAHRLLKKWGIYKYFEKVYISSEYDVQKKDKVFFDYPIKDFAINCNETIFIDDKEELLDIAKNKGLQVILMNRNECDKESKYGIITSLNNIE